MTIRPNAFKRALADGRSQLGLWVSLPGAWTAEALATCGYDWLLFDTEHAPGDPLTVLHQLQAAAPWPVEAVVRPAANDTVLIKRMLDIGARSLLIPMVQSLEEAKAAVAAVRYPPEGVRGMAGATRASGFGTVADYPARAADDICLLVQIETAASLPHVEAIAALPGIDGLFIGPADLAASMGHPGDLAHPDVVAAVEDTIRRIRAAGKPAGILTLDRAFARRCLSLGTLFTAVDMDIALLTRGARAALAEFRD